MGSNEKKVNKKYSKLKDIIIYQHHSIELMLKSILADVNILLIFNDIDNKGVLEGFSKYVVDKNSDELLEFLVSSKHLRTIDYMKLVERYRMIFGLNTRHFKALAELGHIRNRIIHFGINEEDYYIVFVTLNNVFELINETLYLRLRVFNERFQFNDLYDLMDEVIEIGREVELDTWKMQFEDKYNEIIFWLNSLISECSFNDILDEQTYKVEHNFEDAI